MRTSGGVELYVLINFYVMLFTIIILTVVYAKNVQEFIVRMCEQNRTFILTRVKRMCLLSTLHFCFLLHLLLLPRALMLCQCVEM